MVSAVLILDYVFAALSDILDLIPDVLSDIIETLSLRSTFPDVLPNVT